MTKLQEGLLKTAAIAVVAVAFYFVASYGLDRSEISDCMKWSQQADALPGFYLTQWQKDQCDAHSIIINAPVWQAQK